jgi:hypothetical protein
MSLVPVMRELMAAGLTGEALLAAMERIEAAQAPVRSKAAERQARYRDRNKASQNVTRDDSDACDAKAPPFSPLPLSPTPPNPNPPISPQNQKQGQGAGGEFEAWYSRYPHKVGRGQAERAFSKAIREASLETLVAGLEAYIRDKPPDRDWCNPATWLNGKRWLDQPNEPQARQDIRHGHSSIQDQFARGFDRLDAHLDALG